MGFLQQQCAPCHGELPPGWRGNSGGRGQHFGNLLGSSACRPHPWRTPRTTDTCHSVKENLSCRKRIYLQARAPDTRPPGNDHPYRRGRTLTMSLLNPRLAASETRPCVGPGGQGCGKLRAPGAGRPAPRPSSPQAVKCARQQVTARRGCTRELSLTRGTPGGGGTPSQPRGLAAVRGRRRSQSLHPRVHRPPCRAPALRPVFLMPKRSS